MLNPDAVNLKSRFRKYRGLGGEKSFRKWVRAVAKDVSAYNVRDAAREWMSGKGMRP